jgi:hypothetical protein
MIETRDGDFFCVPCAEQEGLIGSGISDAAPA